MSTCLHTSWYTSCSISIWIEWTGRMAQVPDLAMYPLREYQLKENTRGKKPKSIQTGLNKEDKHDFNCSINYKQSCYFKINVLNSDEYFQENSFSWLTVGEKVQMGTSLQENVVTDILHRYPKTKSIVQEWIIFFFESLELNLSNFFLRTKYDKYQKRRENLSADT